jgi:hypothetical protein
LADENPAWQHMSLDLHMLIESCGLKIAGIYNKGEGNEGLIEVVIP